MNALNHSNIAVITLLLVVTGLFENVLPAEFVYIAAGIILADISRILAENKIGIFVISTFNTDYILTKEENYQKALDALSRAGYKIIEIY